MQCFMILVIIGKEKDTFLSLLFMSEQVHTYIHTYILLKN